jgi:hypothetical protein
MKNQSNARQAHGFQDEDYLKVAYSGASNHKRTGDEDIEADFDPTGRSLETQSKSVQVKSKTGNATIHLSDAVIFCNKKKTFRLCVVVRERKGQFLHPICIHALIITPDDIRNMMGDLTTDKVENFSDYVRKLSFNPACKQSKMTARKDARNYKKNNIQYGNGIIRVGAKIGDCGVASALRSKKVQKQARVQATVSINSLIKFAISNKIEFETIDRDDEGCLMYNGVQFGKLAADPEKQKTNGKKQKIFEQIVGPVLYERPYSQPDLFENMRDYNRV